MQSHFQKILFLGAIVAAILISGAIRPSLFLSQDAAGAKHASPQAGNPPIVVLPTLTAAIGAQVFDASSSAISVPAAAALVADLENGNKFFEKNADERWPLASVSKLMTAAVANDLLGPEQRITITDSMAAVDPSQLILRVGDTYTVADLLHVLLLPSNNVAAEALAQFSGRANFIAAMNAKAQAWSMANTYYDDPSGLSAANESTADDLFALARHIYSEYPKIFAITRMPQANVAEVSTGRVTTLTNINHFAGAADFLGGKTGYTNEANGNLLSVFSYQNHPIVIVILGINSANRFTDTRRLFDWLKNQ